MKTYTIRWIIGLISVALIGLLCVQLYWVTNAINLKQVLFSQSVNGALSEVVARLEKREVASAVAQTVTMLTEPEHASEHKRQSESYVLAPVAQGAVRQQLSGIYTDSTSNGADNNAPFVQAPALQQPVQMQNGTQQYYVPERAALRERTQRERATEETKPAKNNGNRYVQPSSNRTAPKPNQTEQFTYRLQYDNAQQARRIWQQQDNQYKQYNIQQRIDWASSMADQARFELQAQSMNIHSPTAIINIGTTSDADAPNQVFVVNIDSLRCGVQLMFDSSTNSRQQRIVVRTSAAANRKAAQHSKKYKQQAVARVRTNHCSHQCTEQCEEQSCSHTATCQHENHTCASCTSSRSSQKTEQRTLTMRAPTAPPTITEEHSIQDIMEVLAEQQTQAQKRLQMLQEAIEDVSFDFSFPNTMGDLPDNGMHPIGAQQQQNWLYTSPFARSTDKIRIDHSKARISDALSRSAHKSHQPDIPSAVQAPVAAPVPLPPSQQVQQDSSQLFSFLTATALASASQPPAPRHRTAHFTTAQQPLRNKLLSIQDMASRVVVELATTKKSIEQRVTPSLLDSMLKEELLRRGITIPYQYAVLSQENDFPLIRPALYTNELQESDFRTALYPNDLINKPYFLSIYFPQKNAFIYESMWGVLATSLAFILLLMGCFSFAVVTLVRQKKLSDMKTDFINNMTHEFKTPISTISLASEALRDPIVRNDDNRITRFVNAIYEENRRLGTQVERVLQAAVIDRGDIQLNYAPVHLHDIMQQALGTVALQIESRGGSITCLYNAANDALHGDKIHLANIIINLLDNANKYSPEAPAITIATRNSNNGIVVSVEDRGMGMSREAQKRIFEKFYRVSTGNLHDVKGFGLGLNYVKAMVEAHGGTISVWSEIKKGSRFELYFPHTTNLIEQ